MNINTPCYLDEFEFDQNNVFFVDLDNTLIFSDRANTFAYLDALHKLLINNQKKLNYKLSVCEDYLQTQTSKRLTRHDIRDILEEILNATSIDTTKTGIFDIDITDINFYINNVIEEKEKLYKKYLNELYPNNYLINILKKYKNLGCKLYLVTQSRYFRAYEMLNHFNLTSLFDNFSFYSEEINQKIKSFQYYPNINNYKIAQYKEIIDLLCIDNSKAIIIDDMFNANVEFMEDNIFIDIFLSEPEESIDGFTQIINYPIDIEDIKVIDNINLNFVFGGCTTTTIDRNIPEYEWRREIYNSKGKWGEMIDYEMRYTVNYSTRFNTVTQRNL
ncbi:MULTISPECIES: HAD family hydrolase [Rodentibacter]|uniref:HAD family hydrolase n=1 Tax=Rodentibacter TaxID=1960084 RepID=UPI001CFEDA91|nr:HAD family hydrolase [Rodentibacter sp. JRC1]GJI55569.1 hypothetical protein HEMROJRC1_06810 [Rodentibacter sp. JRC1]